MASYSFKVTWKLFFLIIATVNCQVDLLDVEGNANAEEPTNSKQEIGRAQQGGNFANYNEACSTDVHNGKLCITSRGLYCENRLCKCEQNKENANIPMIYVNNTDVQKCAPEAHARNEYSCNWDRQCQEGKYGDWSRCVNRKCQCYDVEGNRREVVESENTCFLSKKIGDSCSDDLQCNVTIPGEAICLGVKSNAGICQCAHRYIWESSTAMECLPLKTINETCVHDIQCSHTEALGPLARCSYGKCECYDTTTDNYKTVVKYYIPHPNTENKPGKCFYVKSANETCSTSQECKLGYHKNAICKVHASYNGESVCQCIEEGKCNSGVGHVGSFIMIIAAISFSFFVFH